MFIHITVHNSTAEHMRLRQLFHDALLEVSSNCIHRVPGILLS